MRWLLLADIHANRRQMAWLADVAPSYDAVVLAGDLVDLAGHTPLAAQRVMMQKAIRAVASATTVFVVSGNHDVDAPDGSARWLRALAGPNLFVDGSTVSMAGVVVTLWPWAAGFAGGDAQAPRWRHEHLFSNWIWVHHAPPAGTRTSRCPHEGPLAGNARLLERIRRHRPALVLSGHLHDAPFRAAGGWWDEIGETVILNPGHDHGALPAHVVIDFAAGELAWHTATTHETRPLRLLPTLAGVA